MRPSIPWLRRLLVTNLVLEIGIVVTGGLVRLTGSGLGCPTWPQCVPGSFIPVAHQAQGFHKIIEFGNRTLTGVVGIAALAVVLALFRWTIAGWLGKAHGRLDRASLRPAAYVVLGGVVVQAIVGGITVLTRLNPATVAFHFLVSMVLVAASAVLVYREREGDGPGAPLVRHEIRLLAGATTALAGIVLVLGTIVTGSGPHSGDAKEPARFGFDPRSVSWVHADAVMLFLGLVVAVLVAVRLTDGADRAQRLWLIVLAVTLAQGVVGYTQYFTGLPEGVVALHMLGACLLVVALTFGNLSLRRRGPVTAARAAPETSTTTSATPATSHPSMLRGR